jgi:hypothetical protein
VSVPTTILGLDNDEDMLIVRQIGEGGENLAEGRRELRHYRVRNTWPRIDVLDLTEPERREWLEGIAADMIAHGRPVKILAPAEEAQ